MAEATEDKQQSNEKDSKGTKYFKSFIWGLSVIVDPGDGGDVSENKKEVKFLAHQLKIEATGEIQKFGLYKTDNKDEIDVLNENADVEEIDSDTYNLLTEKSSRYVK